MFFPGTPKSSVCAPPSRAPSSTLFSKATVLPLGLGLQETASIFILPSLPAGLFVIRLEVISETLILQRVKALGKVICGY
jgi:hypothetical protein